MSMSMNDRLIDAIVNHQPVAAPVDDPETIQEAVALANTANAELAWSGLSFRAAALNCIPMAVAVDDDGNIQKAEQIGSDWGYYQLDSISADLVRVF